MEDHSLRKLAKCSYGVADQLAVVVVEDFSPDIAISDLQNAVKGTGARGWDVYFDANSLMTTLEVKFEDKERAESYIAKFNAWVCSKMPYNVHNAQ